jgi:hypothetical protein
LTIIYPIASQKSEVEPALIVSAEGKAQLLNGVLVLLAPQFQQWNSYAELSITVPLRLKPLVLVAP